MNITHITISTSILAGGLYTCVRELALAQKAQGESVRVIAYADARSKQDGGPWAPLDPIICNSPVLAGIHFGNGMHKALQAISPDIVHNNGIWLRSSADQHDWAIRNKRPYVVSPHGMLDPWAVRNSSWKKKIVGLWYENRHLRDCPCLHALCEEEAHSFRRYGLDNPIAIIPNGIHLPSAQPNETVPPPWHQEKACDGKRILLFIGRIHPKKGLPLLLEGLHLLKREQPSLLNEWALVIAGYDQGGHLEELRRQTASLGLEEDVVFPGPVNGAIKDAALRTAQASVLPSFSEGLPMSVLEAWVYSLPMLMTAQCNLPSGFKSQAAIKIETNAKSIAAGLMELFSMSDEMRHKMGDNGHKLVTNHFTWDQLAAQHRDVYKWLLGKSPIPDCVSKHKI